MTREGYDVVIQRTADGVERTFRMDCAWNPNLFWWTRGEGNGGCDCNRGNFFDEAGGDDDADNDCSHQRFNVLRFVLDDGSIVPGPVGG